jgi:hypothetical protein
MWLGFYQSGRIQKIRIVDAVSKDIKVTSGVPQGSHLGSLCFICFVNRISEIFDYVHILFYADDIKLFLLVCGFQDCLKIPVKFSYIMDEKMTFSEDVDVMAAKAFAMLGFIRRLFLELRDPYTLKSTYTSPFRLKLEYASCVWNPFYDVCVDRVKRVLRWFIRYALRGLDWTDVHDLPPYEDRCTLLYLDTLTKRRSIACVTFSI